MAKNYYIHRIFNEWEASYPLLFDMDKDLGYLSIGWSDFIRDDLIEIVQNEGADSFNRFMKEHDNDYRSKWSLFRFLQFKEGDIVVVPTFDKTFTICEVTGKPRSVIDLEVKGITLCSGKEATVGDDGIVGKDGRKFDIGFVVPVKKLRQHPLPRSYAEAALVSRMKIRQTNARIDDLKEKVEAAIKAKGSINVHERLMTKLLNPVKETIDNIITPDDLEKMVKWYFEKKGADRVQIPAKNEANKEKGADADVIAEFDDLGLVYYVQVKKHDKITDDWAVNQISEYNKQRQDKREKQDGREGITYISWVVTTADDFTEKTKQLSKESNVRLIAGEEFMRMILNVGLDTIEKIKE